MRTAPDPLSALGHAVGVVRIVIDFRARTKAKRPCRLQTRLIYQSLDWLATRAGLSRYTVKWGRCCYHIGWVGWACIQTSVFRSRPLLGPVNAAVIGA